MTVKSYNYYPNQEVEVVKVEPRFATIRRLDNNEEWRVRWRNLTYNGLQLRLA